MAEENLGLDLASQTGQNNIVVALNAIITALGNITGIQGPKGDTGEPGPQGPAGTNANLPDAPTTEGTYQLVIDANGDATWSLISQVNS